jgi:hypothetical protein
MAANQIGRIALLWRGDRDARAKATAENNRLRPLFEALASLNVAAEPAVYSDEIVDEVRDQLLRLDGVLVWVDPISDGHDRSILDAMLREVAAKGVWVSAHPDVILLTQSRFIERIPAISASHPIENCLRDVLSVVAVRHHDQAITFGTMRG